MRPTTSEVLQWTMFRGTVITIICLVQIVLFTLSTLALAFGSAGAFEICGVVLNLATMFSVVAFHFHKIVYTNGGLDKARNISIFAALAAFSFALLALLVFRICSRRTGSLNSAFAALGEGIAESVVILAIFSFLLALIGLAAAFVSCYEEAGQKISLKNAITISNAQSVWHPFTTQNPPPQPPNSTPSPYRVRY